MQGTPNPEQRISITSQQSPPVTTTKAQLFALSPLPPNLPRTLGAECEVFLQDTPQHTAILRQE
jgi:hypothetical protein